MSTEPPRLALIGAGRMGGAMLDGWIAAKDGLAARSVLVIDPHPEARKRAQDRGCSVAAALTTDAARELDSLVLAVKPQSLETALGDGGTALPAGLLVLSILAGSRIASILAQCPGAAIVRAMPNTPAAIGKGVTAFVAAPEVTDDQRARAVALLSVVGDTVELAEEGLLDAATAVSGSGPAYVFLLAEALAAAGEAEGLPREAAQKLAWATVAGAGALLGASDIDPAELRASVTSPGGTTAAGLAVLGAEGGLHPLMRATVAAAAQRGRELGDS